MFCDVSLFPEDDLDFNLLLIWICQLVPWLRALVFKNINPGTCV